MSIGIGYDANLRFDFACGGYLPPSYGVTLLCPIYDSRVGKTFGKLAAAFSARTSRT
jgi:hypothetical protein